MATFQRRTEYPARNVKYLVEGYATLRHMKSVKPGRGLDLLCELADIDGAISQLGPVEYQAVLLHGLIGLSQEDTADVLGVSQETVSRRYARALEMLQATLNGELA